MNVADNAKTMKSFNESMQSFSSGFKAYAKSADQAGGAAITRAHEALPGIAKKGVETAKLTGSDMNQAVFEGSPLGTAIGDSAMSMGKAFLGMDEKKEDDSTVISSSDGAGTSLSELGPQSDQLSDIKSLLANIDIGVDGLVGLSTEMLGVWVDAEAMERIMHEELMAEGANDRLRSIEEERERKSIVPVSEAGEAPSTGGGGILGALGSVMSSIPGFDVVSGLFSGGLGGIAKLFGKLFFPITMIIGIFSFIEGFMKGYEEGGLQEGITQGFENVLENLVDVPLNFLKDIVAFVAGMLGFDDFEKSLNETEIDSSSIVRPIIEGIVGMYEAVVNFLTGIKDSLMNFSPTDAIKDLASGAGDFIGGFFSGDDAEPEPEPKPTPASAPASEKVDPQDSPRPKRKPKYSKEELKIRAKKRSIGILSESKKEKDDEISARKALIADDPENEDFVSYQNGMIEMLQGHSDHFGAMIAKKESDLALMQSPDARAGAAKAVQDAGVSSGMAGGGASPTIIVDQKDQSVSQAASNLVPMPFHTQTDPAMAQSANVDL